jgi:hypothetical protein
MQVPHLDLLSTFRRYRPDELIVSRADPHPNERATGIAAEELVDFLKKNLKPAETRASSEPRVVVPPATEPQADGPQSQR